MEAYFNELSCYPLCESKECAQKRAYKFASLLTETKKRGFNIVRCHDNGIAHIPLCCNYSIADFCYENLPGITNYHRFYFSEAFSPGQILKILFNGKRNIDEFDYVNFLNARN